MSLLFDKSVDQISTEVITDTINIYSICQYLGVKHFIEDSWCTVFFLQSWLLKQWCAMQETLIVDLTRRFKGIGKELYSRLKTKHKAGANSLQKSLTNLSDLYFETLLRVKLSSKWGPEKPDSPTKRGLDVSGLVYNSDQCSLFGPWIFSRSQRWGQKHGWSLTGNCCQFVANYWGGEKHHGNLNCVYPFTFWLVKAILRLLKAK